MVFKKPYGFLIKHFKLIHLILTGLFIYLTFKVNGILGYYNKFILGTVGKLEAIEYVTNYYSIAVFLSITICVIMYALLRYKKKPRTLYLVLIGFVLLVSFMIQLSYGGLETIYFSVLSARDVRLYRDLLRILVVFQYISIGIVLVRGLGFDIKKFNFVSDLEELDIDISDDEEVELTLGGGNNLNRKFNRRIREFKYYYLENKNFINIIILVVVFLSFGTWIVNREVINKVFSQGEVVATNDFQFKVLDTFVTEKGYDNNVIKKGDNSFVVIKMVIASNGEKKKLNTSNLILEVNNHSYSSNNYYGSRFSDLGNVYQNQKISGAVTYLFVYEVKKNDIDNKMKIVYAGDKTVNLDVVKLDEVKDTKNYKMGDNIDLSSSSLSSGSIKITSMELAEKFDYIYQYEIEEKAYSSKLSISSIQKVIMHLEIESSYSRDLNNYSFLERYGIIKYKKGEEEYILENFIDKTPGDYKEGLYLGVDKNLVDADSIWLEIQIRNKQYIYTLK